MVNNYVGFDIIVNFGVSPKYLKNAINLCRQGKSQYWQNKKDPTDKRKVLINLDSIPAGTRLKYNIPTSQEYREQQLKAFEAQKEQEKIERYQAEQREKELANIYKNDSDGYVNSLYMDYAQILLIIDEIEIIKHSISEFAKEKNLKPRQSYFDRHSKQLDFENSKNIFQNTNNNKLSSKFIDDFCSVLKQCKNAILQDLANIVSFHYNSIGFYYNKTE